MARTERKTQAERRSATRAALLDATLDALTELGYSRTTTTEVTRRAGVSQGALFKHFPTKSALVAAAAEQLFAESIETFREAFSRSGPPGEAGGGEPSSVWALRRLWEVFRAPRLLAAYRLFVEGPADPELMAALAPVVAAHQRNIERCAADLFPEAMASPQTSALLSIVLFALQGMALQRPVHVEEERERLLLAELESLARVLLPGPPAGPPGPA